MTHNHSDRGALHDDCSACEVVAQLMSEAGVNPAQVRDLRRDAFDFTKRTPLQKVVDSISKPTLSFDGPIPYRLIRQQARAGGKASILALIQHLFNEHDLVMDFDPLSLDLRQMQEVHAGLHHLGKCAVEHGNAEHFVGPYNDAEAATKERLEAQRRDKEMNRRRRAEEHARRTESARDDRLRVMAESARDLTRAIRHAAGTVVPRASFDDADQVTVKVDVGVKDRITVAAATIGLDTAIGTAVCHPNDRFNPVIGRQLAIARALISLGSVHELAWMTKVEEANS